MANYEMNPTDELDFDVNWAPHLESGETVSSSTWSAEAGITIMSGGGKDPVILSGNLRTKAWLTGGTKGITYEVTNTVVTSAGRKESRTLLVDVTQR